MSLIAQYNSMCGECGSQIIADLDEIVVTEDGAIHEDCAPRRSEPFTFPL